MVFIGAQQIDGQGRYGQRLAAGRRLVVLAKRDMTQIGQKAGRRQVVPGRGNLQRPFQRGPHAPRPRHRRALPPQSLHEKATGLVRVAQFVSAHKSVVRGP